MQIGKWKKLLKLNPDFRPAGVWIQKLQQVFPEPYQ